MTITEIFPCRRSRRPPAERRIEIAKAVANRPSPGLVNSVGFWIAAVVSVSRSLSRSESPQFLQIGVEMAEGGGHGLLAGFIRQVTFGRLAFPSVMSARWSRSTRRSSPSWSGRGLAGSA